MVAREFWDLSLISDFRFPISDFCLYVSVFLVLQLLSFPMVSSIFCYLVNYISWATTRVDCDK